MVQPLRPVASTASHFNPPQPSMYFFLPTSRVELLVHDLALIATLLLACGAVEGYDHLALSPRIILGFQFLLRLPRRSIGFCLRRLADLIERRIYLISDLAQLIGSLFILIHNYCNGKHFSN